LVSHIVGGTYGESVGTIVLRGIFGPERDEVTDDWRKVHN